MKYFSYLLSCHKLPQNLMVSEDSLLLIYQVTLVDRAHRDWASETAPSTCLAAAVATG